MTYLGKKTFLANARFVTSVLGKKCLKRFFVSALLKRSLFLDKQPVVSRLAFQAFFAQNTKRTSKQPFTSNYCYLRSFELYAKFHGTSAMLKASKKTTVISSIIIIFLLSSCKKSKDDYKIHFNKNEKGVDELFDYLSSKYMQPLRNARNRIVFVKCNDKDRWPPVGTCDDFVTEKMNELQFKEIRLEKEMCNETNEFDKIYIMVDKKEYYPIVYYVYDMCKKRKNFQSNTIKHESIKPHWSLLIDSSYP